MPCHRDTLTAQGTPPPAQDTRPYLSSALNPLLIIIRRERKLPPGATRVTRCPSVRGPRPSRPDPTLYLSNLTGPGMGLICTLSGSALLPWFHPSSGWGSGLARHLRETGNPARQLREVARPSPLGHCHQIVAPQSFTLREPHTVPIFQIGRVRVLESEITQLRFTQLWKLGSGCVGTFPQEKTNPSSS